LGAQLIRAGPMKRNPESSDQLLKFRHWREEAPE
jgi:hypothetical protein